MVSTDVNKQRQRQEFRSTLSLGQACALVVAMVFQHFQLASLMGYPLTLGAVAAIAILFVVPAKANWVKSLWIFPALVSYTAIAAFLDPRYASPLQYARTLALVCATIVFVIAGYRGMASGPKQRVHMHLPLLLALSAVVALAVVQVATGLAGSTTFFNPFGQFQYLYHYDPWLAPGEMPRAASFFLEPSYAALVITCLVAVLLKTATYYPVVLLLGGVGVFACQSASGLVAYALMIFVWGLGYSRAAARLSLIATLGFILISGGYLLTRIASADDSTSSTYYRLVAPLSLLSEVLSGSPLGRALGSVEAAVSAANLRNGTTEGTSIDNGYILLVFYFGWVGLALVFSIIAFLVRRIVYAIINRTGNAPIYAWILLSFMFNGGIFLPEFAFMIWLALAVAGSSLSEVFVDAT